MIAPTTFSVRGSTVARKKFFRIREILNFEKIPTRNDTIRIINPRSNFFFIYLIPD